MHQKLEHLAREIARKAGYDPDQVVIAFDPEKDFDLMAIGVVPVDIKNLHPLFTRFYRDAIREYEKEEHGKTCNS